MANRRTVWVVLSTCGLLGGLALVACSSESPSSGGQKGGGDRADAAAGGGSSTADGGRSNNGGGPSTGGGGSSTGGGGTATGDSGASPGPTCNYRAGNDKCAACFNEKCCSDGKICDDDPGCKGLVACLQKCSDFMADAGIAAIDAGITCSNDCLNAASKEAFDKLVAYSKCGFDKCTPECE